ncbi:MAG: GntR family transcriptional regulator [Gammaproteobacteria bacterium]
MTPARQRFHEIHYLIRQRIALLQYPPQTRLDIDKLATEFKVSRTPIRTVLQRLEYQGLVVTRHGVGTTVSDIDFEHLREAVIFRLRLAELIGELSPLDPAPEVINDLATARADCQQLLAQPPNLEAFGRIDIRVHESICSLIGNAHLRQIYDDLYYRTVRIWFHFLPRLNWQDEIAIFLRYIEDQLVAMQRGDTRAVGFLIRNAVSGVVIRLDHLFAEMEVN